jgi:pantoate--beta-alanine ligase
MRTLRTVQEVRAALAGERRHGQRIGLVPTMGAFHEGHLSLMRCARAACDVVVVSLFVNPAQFGEAADLDAYPRDEARDAELAQGVGVDLLFAPTVAEMYPAGFDTTVVVRGVSEPLEGVHRGREHFDAVATVVVKLLGIVGPDVAYFGDKDAQQLLVVRRLVEDLNIPVQIESCPTVRDRDGLALSSRNARLGPDERVRARSLHRALLAAGEALASGERDPAAVRARGLEVLEAGGVQTEYFELADPRTLEPVADLNAPTLALVAARVGQVRLIDNLLLEPAGFRGATPTEEVLACSGRC